MPQSGVSFSGADECERTAVFQAAVNVVKNGHLVLYVMQDVVGEDEVVGPLGNSSLLSSLNDKLLKSK